MIRRYVMSRVLQGTVVILGALAIGFVLTNAIGRPADVIGGPFISAEERAALNARLGYDLPLLPRFLEYLKNIGAGDFGISYRTNGSAMGTVLSVLPNTLLLVLAALSVAVLVALPLAIFSARHRTAPLDRLLRRAIGALQGMPEFWLGLMLILVFSVQFNVLPSFGFSGLRSLVLPTIALSLPVVPTLFRLFRGHLLDVLGSDFVEAMRARGLSEGVIVYRHGLRNMLGPSVTYAALQLGYLIGGSLIVELVFSWPGVGNLFVSSVQARDFSVVQSVIVVIAVCYVTLNLLADLVVLLADPRLRIGSG